MKKMIIALAMLSLLGSCNRKLKKEIAEMDNEISQLKDKQKNVNNVLGIDEPMVVTFNTTDNSNAPVTNNRSYMFKGSDNYSQSITNLNNGTYSVYIRRRSTISFYYEGYISFIINPTTGAVSNYYVQCEFPTNYGGYAVPRFYSHDPNASINFTVNAFNAATGQVSVFVSASTTAASAYNIYSGKAMSGTWAFAGTLPLYE